MNKLTFFIVLFLSTLNTFGDNIEKNVFDLSSDKWLMEGTLPGQGIKKQFDKYIPDGSSASVPGDVYTDLWRVGRIDDMNIGTNSQKAKWVMDYEWWYFRNFDVPKNMVGKEIFLQFDGVDYACDVYLNGTFLGTHEGMMSGFDFNITKLINLTTISEPKDNNYLAIRLHPAPRTLGLVNGRKYRWHGDYNQNVTPTGIYRPVKLVATGKARITDFYTRTILNKNGSARIDIELEVENNSSLTRSINSVFTLNGQNFKSKEYKLNVSSKLKSGKNKIKASLNVEDPKLWWPWDMGDQNLYEAKVAIYNENKIEDVESHQLGIREVKMTMNPGWTKEQVEHPWTVMINGKHHFVRSGTWGGPPDIFTGRTNEDTYKRLVALAKEENINNLRIFNWHPAEIPIFYKLCNEAGITVWQDIAPVNNPILHLGNDYKSAIFNEAIASLKERRNHPCNIIIEGSEEILYMSSASAREFQNEFVVELGDTLRKYTDLHYLPTSPLSSFGSIKLGYKPNESAHPHGVHYGMGNMFMEDYYPKQNYAAIPELAVTSCPNVETIKKIIPANEVWPPGPSWGYKWADLDILQGHNYEVFGEDFTNKSLDEFVEATQIAQGVYFQYAMELYRTRKPKMSAICFCHFILNTPDFKWATVDYFLQPKKSHYYIKKCYQPLLATLQYNKRRWLPNETFSGKFWVVNDFTKGFKSCNASIKILDNSKNVIETKKIKVGDIKEDSSIEISDLKFKVPGKMNDKFYVEIELKDETGKIVSSNDYFFLVDDQNNAKLTYKKYGKAFRDRRERFGSNTNRYFPGLFDKTKSVSVEWINVDNVKLGKDDLRTLKQSGVVIQ